MGKTAESENIYLRTSGGMKQVPMSLNSDESVRESEVTFCDPTFLCLTLVILIFGMEV